MESLPKHFVVAMKTLFHIMDDKQTGYVKLSDIENRWRDDRTKGLPRGVIESLQKVASHDGLLTFDRFCAGLKICLLQNQAENNTHKSNEMFEQIPQRKISKNNSHLQLPPITDLKSEQLSQERWNNVVNPEVNLQYRNSDKTHTAIVSQVGKDERISQSRIIIPPDNNIPVRIYGPPKPPRIDKCDTKDLIINNYDDNEENDNKQDIIYTTDNEQGRGLGDGRSNNDPIQVQKKLIRRREPRRHTLQNGIDYNLLKRMKHVEQEKDVLLQGLSAVEEAREWYLNQLEELQEKMRFAGRMGAYVEPWNEAHQERLELLRLRVNELNRQLGALVTGWRSSIMSLHMNLALPISTMEKSKENDANALKNRNQILLKEVSRKNDRISMLECERSALIRELLLQRSRNKRAEYN